MQQPPSTIYASREHILCLLAILEQLVRDVDNTDLWRRLREEMRSEVWVFYPPMGMEGGTGRGCPLPINFLSCEDIRHSNSYFIRCHECGLKDVLEGQHGMIGCAMFWPEDERGGNSYRKRCPLNGERWWTSLTTAQRLQGVIQTIALIKARM